MQSEVACILRHTKATKAYVWCTTLKNVLTKVKGASWNYALFAALFGYPNDELYTGGCLQCLGGEGTDALSDHDVKLQVAIENNMTLNVVAQYLYSGVD